MAASAMGNLLLYERSAGEGKASPERAPTLLRNHSHVFHEAGDGVIGFPRQILLLQAPQERQLSSLTSITGAAMGGWPFAFCMPWDGDSSI